MRADDLPQGGKIELGQSGAQTIFAMLAQDLKRIGEFSQSCG